jgi:hypothetical protein
VARVDAAVEQYLAELARGRDATRALYEEVKRRLRDRW